MESVLTYNFDLAQGDAIDLPLILNDTEGSPMNLYGYSAIAKLIRASTGELGANLTVSISEDTLGLVNVSLASIDSNRLPVTSSNFDEYEIYTWYLAIVDEYGNKTRVIEGHVSVSPGGG